MLSDSVNSSTPLDARHFVATINPDTFHQKYAPIVASSAFKALFENEECTSGQLNQVSHALHDAGIPGNLLNGPAQVVDIAGHLLQRSFYFAARAY